jgi:cytochrome c oxidase subunit IV
MSGHVSPVSLYITIFGALMVLTAVTVGAAFVDLGQLNFAVAMAIAGFKATLVIWYFMHVKYASKLTKLTVATGLFFLAILLGMSLIDYVSRDFAGQGPVPVNPDAVISAPAAH